MTDQAGDLWSNFENADNAALYAVLMEHEARQSALLYLRDAFNAYLASARVENPAIPAFGKTKIVGSETLVNNYR